MRKLMGLVAALLTAILVLSGFTFDPSASGAVIYDDEGFLSEEVKTEITQKSAEIRSKIQSDVLVVFTSRPEDEDNNREAERILKTWIDSGRGYGEQHETVLMYVNMQEGNRAVAVYEHNDAKEYKLKDAKIDSLKETLAGLLKDGKCDDAVRGFVSQINKAMKPGFFRTIWGWLTVALLGGGISSGIAKGSNKSPGSAPSRRHYMAGAVTVLKKNESFLRTDIVRKAEASESENDKPSGEGENEGNHGGSASF